MNQYYLSLGEFDADNFKDHPHKLLCFFFFIYATLFTQITMLNMLIAIMSDTFERATNDTLSINRKNKLALMYEYKGFRAFKLPENSFMFKVTVEQE